MKRFIRQLEKLQEALENSLYTCFKCGNKNMFSVAKQARSADEGTSVFNECLDCHNKWRDGRYPSYNKLAIMNHKGVPAFRDTNHFNHIGHFRR